MLCAVGFNGKGGVGNFRGVAENAGFREKRKLFQIHLLLTSAWKAFGGHKHQARCGSPALCLDHALLLHAQQQQRLQEEALRGTLAPFELCVS